MIPKLKSTPLLSVFVLSFICCLIVASPSFAVPACPDGYHYDSTARTCVRNSPPPPTTTPAADVPSCPQKVFGFPAWYRGVVRGGNDAMKCDLKMDSLLDFVKIPLNVLASLIMAVAYAAVGYIIWGGFKYSKSQGDPGKITEAKGAIINALTGLAIALASVGIVEFIQGRIV